MSARAEKLEQARMRDGRSGPARCTLTQLQGRWGRVTLPRAIQPDAVVVLEAMGGTEQWKVTGVKDGEVHLEQMGGNT